MNSGGAYSTGASKGTSDNSKSAIGKERDRLKSVLKQHLKNKFTLKIRDDNGREKRITVHVFSEDYKHLVNDIISKRVIDKTKTRKIPKYLKNSYQKKSSTLYKERKDKIDKFYYFKNRGKKLYFNIARYKYKRKNGSCVYKYRLHALTNRCK